MELRTGRIFEPEVAEVDGYWVHVAVAQDVRFPINFNARSRTVRAMQTVKVRPGLSKPVEEPQILREFRTPSSCV